MRYRFMAAVGLIAIAAGITVPASPAQADSFRTDQWYLKALRINQAHTLTKGSGVTVAVLDTGAFPHPDVRRNLLPGANLIPGQSGDGRSDRVGHGTEMAALVAAHGRGSNGVLGIAPAAKVLPVKISNTIKAPSNEMADGIDWAIDNKARVINISAAIGPSFDVQDAVSRAKDSDVVVVGSVGNAPGDLIIGYPAAIEGVLAVGSVGPDGQYSGKSVKDKRVQICAPGIKITTAEPEKKYVDVSGTSPAAAIASGAAALVRAKFPELSAREVVHRITATADDIGPPGRDDECGFGRLNIVKALTAEVPPLEGGEESATPSATATASSAPPVVRPETAPPAAESEPAGNSGVLLFGGLAGVVAAAAVVLVLLLRRRGRN
ncbi:S8 family serine peptidase [Paractinoplanes lichenicola]|uniref:S8 family serine peptidase n=1 Tax=Paractinoplanes lichenicola TaxID=2802976 RepID=A0ABS1VJR8_9ACTN|nr:S8 family serine peptidase [Actinoplanes lichenicola]MBL7254833.1 S8 family serine peptidase [Actinoplanes lichenicola]